MARPPPGLLPRVLSVDLAGLILNAAHRRAEKSLVTADLFDRREQVLGDRRLRNVSSSAGGNRLPHHFCGFVLTKDYDLNVGKDPAHLRRCFQAVEAGAWKR